MAGFSVVVGHDAHVEALMDWTAVALTILGPLMPSAQGHHDGDLFGVAIVPLGDVDGDQRGDFVVGAALDGPERQGAVWVFSGASGEPICRVAGRTAGDYFGGNLDQAGDVDGDGVADFVVGVGSRPDAEINFHIIPGTWGYVSVYSGRDARLLWALDEPRPWTDFGASVAGVGDLDCDGRDDIAVSFGQLEEWTVPGTDWTRIGLSEAGLRVLGGTSGEVLREIRWPSRVDDWAQTPIRGCADLDGDMVPEILAAGTDAIEELRVVRVFSGASGRKIRSLPGGVGERDYASTLTEVGDVDGDGVADQAAGHPVQYGQPDGEPDQSVRVFSGLDGELLHYLHLPNDANERDFGEAIGGAGDIDLDGCADFLVGAPGTWEPWGVVRLYSGLSGEVIREWKGRPTDTYFGSGVAGLGDVDGDRVPDVAIATVAWFAPDMPGSVRVFSGQDGGLLYELKRDRALKQLQATHESND